MSGSQLSKKFPQFTTDDSYVAIYQEEAGLVDAALGNAVHIQLARSQGATVIDNCPVLKIDKRPDGKIKVTR